MHRPSHFNHRSYCYEPRGPATNRTIDPIADLTVNLIISLSISLSIPLSISNIISTILAVVVVVAVVLGAPVSPCQCLAAEEGVREVKDMYESLKRQADEDVEGGKGREEAAAEKRSVQGEWEGSVM